MSWKVTYFGGNVEDYNKAVITELLRCFNNGEYLYCQEIRYQFKLSNLENVPEIKKELFYKLKNHEITRVKDICNFLSIDYQELLGAYRTMKNEDAMANILACLVDGAYSQARGEWIASSLDLRDLPADHPIKQQIWYLFERNDLYYAAQACNATGINFEQYRCHYNFIQSMANYYKKSSMICYDNSSLYDWSVKYSMGDNAARVVAIGEEIHRLMLCYNYAGLESLIVFYKDEFSFKQDLAKDHKAFKRLYDHLNCDSSPIIDKFCKILGVSTDELKMFETVLYKKEKMVAIDLETTGLSMANEKPIIDYSSLRNGVIDNIIDRLKSGYFYDIKLLVKSYKDTTGQDLNLDNEPLLSKLKLQLYKIMDSSNSELTIKCVCVYCDMDYTQLRNGWKAINFGKHYGAGSTGKLMAYMSGKPIGPVKADSIGKQVTVNVENMANKIKAQWLEVFPGAKAFQLQDEIILELPESDSVKIGTMIHSQLEKLANKQQDEIYDWYCNKTNIASGIVSINQMRQVNQINKTKLEPNMWYARPSTYPDQIWTFREKPRWDSVTGTISSIGRYAAYLRSELDLPMLGANDCLHIGKIENLKPKVPQLFIHCNSLGGLVLRDSKDDYINAVDKAHFPLLKPGYKIQVELHADKFVSVGTAQPLN